MLSSALIYAYVVVGSRVYGEADFAPATVLLSLWFLGVALFGFPLEQWVLQLRTAPLPRRDFRAASLAVAAFVSLGAAAVGIGAYAARGALFDDSSPVFALIASALVLACAATGVLRGILAASGRYDATAASIVAENFVRLAAGATFAGIGLGVSAYTAALPLGGLIAPLWIRAWRGVADLRTDLAARDRSVGQAVGRVVTTAAGQGLAQALLAAPPIVVAALNGAPATVTATFGLLAVLRVPMSLASSMTTRVSAAIRELAATGDATVAAKRVRSGAMAVVLAAVAAGAIGAALQGALIAIVVGPGTVLPVAAAAALSAGAILALGGFVNTLALVALDRPKAALGVWALTPIVTAPVLFLSVQPTISAANWLLSIEAAALVLSAVAVQRACATHRHSRW